MNSVNLNLASVTISKPHLLSKATVSKSGEENAGQQVELILPSGEENAGQQVGLILSWHDQIMVVTWLLHYCP